MLGCSSSRATLDSSCGCAGASAAASSWVPWSFSARLPGFMLPGTCRMRGGDELPFLPAARGALPLPATYAQLTHLGLASAARLSAAAAALRAGLRATFPLLLLALRRRRRALPLLLVLSLWRQHITPRQHAEQLACKVCGVAVHDVVMQVVPHCIY